MEAAAHGHSTLGIPKKVGEEFARADAKDEATLAPNAAIPAYRTKPTCDSAGATGHAAGTLLVSPEGHVLLLRRSGDEANYAHYWALPGGGVDEGETPEQGAAREMREEIGHEIEGGKPKLLDRRRTPTGSVFHTFVQPVSAKFEPRLNGEHSGYTWSPLDALPQPMHPAVAATLQDRVGIAADMKPEDWSGLRDGFLKWTREEEKEPEHAQDEAMIAMDRASTRSSAVMASDSPLAIAMDRDSVREKTRDGRLIVKRTHVTKANVCPYRGEEIPGWQDLGLDKDRVYYLLRDPEELRKAAPTLNGVQLLHKHTPVSAQDPHQDKTVGSLGTDAEFDGEYLDNSIFVNTQDAIDAIESRKTAELSAGYHYKPDMTPGNFRGSAYDGVMRDIVFNHVALVEDGRAGPDVVVADEALKETDNMAKLTRFGGRTLSISAAMIAPLLAMDQKVSLPKDLFAPLTSKNFKDKRDKLLSGVRSSIDGRLRAGLALDATMEGLAKAIDAFNDDITEGMDEPAPEDKQEDLFKSASIEAAPSAEPAKGITEPGATYDAAKGFMRDCGMDEEQIAKCMDMMPKNGLASDAEETDDEKAAREKKEADEKTAKDAEMKDMVTKPAMDAALKAQSDHFQKELKGVREAERGIRVAIAEVQPWVGELPASMAFDSAADVYRHALVMKGVDGAKDLHPDALKPILTSLPKAGARPPEHHEGSASIAMDSSVVAKATKIAPGLEGISNIL